VTYSVGLLGMSWASRINSLAMIYEFELTYLKECELFMCVSYNFQF